MIKDLPADYSVEKVVEELEKEKENHTNGYNASFYKDNLEVKARFEQTCMVIDKAIEIVRDESIKEIPVNRDVEKVLTDWKYSPKENIAICEMCGYEHYLGTYHQYATNYCPNCGAKKNDEGLVIWKN